MHLSQHDKHIWMQDAPPTSRQYKVNLGRSTINLGQIEVGVPKKQLEK